MKAIKTVILLLLSAIGIACSYELQYQMPEKEVMSEKLAELREFARLSSLSGEEAV